VIPTTTLLFWGGLMRLFFLMWLRFMAATRHCRRSADYAGLLAFGSHMWLCRERRSVSQAPSWIGGLGKSLDHTLFQTKYCLHASKSATSVKKYDTNIWVSIPVPMKGW
jgi:hypothetical protein